MTLFFSLKKLENQAAANDSIFLQILKDHYTTSVLNKSVFSKYKKINGTSYLLNPQPLFTQTIDIAYIVQYIKLASLRDYTVFKLFNIITLDTSFFPEIDTNAIQKNPLIKITNKQIKFKFEEIYYGAKFR